MNQLVSDSLIEILDRKFNFTVNSPLDSFMLDLHRFLDFLRDDELIREFTNRVKEDFHQKARGYQWRLANEKQEAIEIRDALIKRYPELDDSNAQAPTGIDSTFD